MTRSPATGVGPGVSNSYGFGTQSNDLVALADMVTQGSVAAVVVEVAQRGILDEDLLRSLREVCDSTSTVLVFDEILSGFRYRMGSASEVVPDLACFGKSIGNGYSVSALVGRRDLMQVLDPGGVFFSGTSFGETTGLAACEATLRIMDQDRVPHQLGQIGRLLKVRINDIAEIDGSPEDIWAGDGARITQSFPWPGPASDLFQQECARRGVLFMGAHNLSCSHDEQAISRLVQVYEEVGSYIGDLDQDSYESMLEAPPTTVPYRMQ
jgi:glutamate-1-semialdehyde 2,1-aminomutase